MYEYLNSANVSLMHAFVETMISEEESSLHLHR